MKSERIFDNRDEERRRNGVLRSDSEGACHMATFMRHGEHG